MEKFHLLEKTLTEIQVFLAIRGGSDRQKSQTANIETAILGQNEANFGYKIPFSLVICGFCVLEIKTANNESCLYTFTI
jgi:hypothetical protein